MKILDHGHIELVDSMPAMARESFEESFSEKQQPLTLDRVWGLGDQRIVDAARVSRTKRAR